MAAYDDRPDEPPAQTAAEHERPRGGAPPEPREIVPDPQEAAVGEPEAPKEAFSEQDHWVGKDAPSDGSADGLV